MQKLVVAVLGLLAIAVPAAAQECPPGFDCAGFDGTVRKAGPPELPDYLAAPFRWVGDVPNVTAAEYPELGNLALTTYATSDKMAPGESAVYVLRRVMDNRLAYAEWQQISADGKTCLRWIYLYQGATYLPDYGKWIFKTLIVQPVVIVKE